MGDPYLAPRKKPPRAKFYLFQTVRFMDPLREQISEGVVFRIRVKPCHATAVGRYLLGKVPVRRSYEVRVGKDVYALSEDELWDPGSLRSLVEECRFWVERRVFRKSKNRSI